MESVARSIMVIASFRRTIVIVVARVAIKGGIALMCGVKRKGVDKLKKVLLHVPRKNHFYSLHSRGEQ